MSNLQRLINSPRHTGSYDTAQPWVCWWFQTHERFWPPWQSSRVLGRAKVLMRCAVCGHTDTFWLRMRRFGPIGQRGDHPIRARFKVEHAHPDRGNPAGWKLPMLNPAAWEGGLDPDLLAMRLQADLADEHGSL